MNEKHRTILIYFAVGITLLTIGVHLYDTSKSKINDFPYAENRPPSNHFPVTPEPDRIEVEPQEPEWELNIGEVKEENVKRHVYYLASQELEGRMSGKSGHKKALDYADTEFKKYGLETF